MLEFRQPSVAIHFGFELAVGRTSPAELCQLVNQGLSHVLPQARLMDWDASDQTLRLRLKLDQYLLMEQGPVSDWLLAAGHSGLVNELHPTWPTPSVEEVWTSPLVAAWNPPRLGSMACQLSVNRSPLGPLTNLASSVVVSKAELVHMRLVLPAAGSLARVDMAPHPFNAYFRADPVNLWFQALLAERVANLLAGPPHLADQFGVCFPTRIDEGALVVWTQLPSPVWDVTLRLTTFWQNYLLPQTGRGGGGGLTRITLRELANFRPRRQGEVAASLAPYPNPGQSLFPSPLALCSDVLLGDTFLNPRWSYPCLGLIEPSRDKFRLVHAPFLRLEGIEGLGQNISLYLVDCQGRRILPGADSRVWVELSNF